MVELSLIAFLLWWAFQAKHGEAEALFYDVLRKPLVIAVSAFALAFLIATAFAHDPHGAFWSNYERGDGGFQMLHYYAFFLLAVMLLKDWKAWKRAFQAFCLAALIMILYGVAGYMMLTNTGRSVFCSKVDTEQGARYQCPTVITPYQGGAVPETFFGRFKNASGTTIYEPGILTGPRFQGSLGNPAYVAPYLTFAIFFVAFLWTAHQSRAKTHLPRWRRSLPHLGYGVLILVFLAFFTFSQTRGGFLGLAAAFILTLVLITVLWRAKRTMFLVLCAAIFLGGGVLYAWRDTPLVRSLPISRFLDVSVSNDTFQTRFWTWGSAIEGWKERPLFGWGPENFSAVFDKHFDPRHFVPGKNSETWFDRAHSVIFDYLSETGIVGLATFLGMFVVFYFALAKRAVMHAWKTSAMRGKEVVQIALLAAIPAAYLVQGLALFDVLPIYLGLFLFLAFGVFYLESRATISHPLEDHAA